MKKIILGLIFALIVSVCVGTACATSDVDNMAVDDSTPLQDMFISVDVGDLDYNLVYTANSDAGDLDNSTAVPDYGFKSVSNDSSVSDDLGNSTNVSDYGFKPVISAESAVDSNISNKTNINLNITGSKNSYDFLKRWGPDYIALYDVLHNIKGPKVKDNYGLLYQRACRFAAVFIQHPEWGLADYVNYVAKFYDNENVIASIVVDAHNIALRNYAGHTKMAINYYLSIYSVYTYILWAWAG